MLCCLWPPPPPRARVLLWVQLVERAVHTHGDVQVVQSPVLTDLVHHRRHSGSADLSGATGHGAAHLLDDNTVITGAVESQLLQDRPDLQQRQTIARRGGGERGGVVVRGQPTAGESPDTSQLLPEAALGLTHS